MGNNFIFPEYLSANSVRAFPLSESANRLDTSRTLTFPNSLLVAAAINAVPAYVTGKFFISRLLCFPDFVTVELSFAPETGELRLICQVRADRMTHVENTSYAIAGTGEDAAVTGSLTLGNITQAQSESLGIFLFNSDSTPFEVSCLFVSVPALNYIEVLSGNSSLGKFNNVLRLREGRNIRLVQVDTNTIRIDAIDGLNLTPPDGCESLPSQTGPIKTINGIPPDADGNFTLDESDCISIEPTANGVIVKDTCSASCCGCSELAALEAAKAALEIQTEQLRSQILAVQSNQTAMIINLIAGLP